MEITIGPFGSATETNDKGERFLMLAGTSRLSIGNTFFGHRRVHKMTWTSPDGGTQNEIDYICISSRWRSSLYDVRTYRGADAGSDYNLVIGKIRLKLKKKTSVKTERPYAVGSLKTRTRQKDSMSNLATDSTSYSIAPTMKSSGSYSQMRSGKVRKPPWAEEGGQTENDGLQVTHGN